MSRPARAGTRGNPTRFAAFAKFFKGYMSVWAIAAASIPIPIGSWKLIPIYAHQRGFLTVYASLTCFLLLAAVFSIRHRLSVILFSRSRASALVAILPFFFLALTLISIFFYHLTLQRSLAELRSLGVVSPTRVILDSADVSDIPYALALSISYLGIFVFAEAAFLLTAVREYLQDALHLDELALLRGETAVEHETRGRRARSADPSVPHSSAERPAGGSR